MIASDIGRSARTHVIGAASNEYITRSFPACVDPTLLSCRYVIFALVTCHGVDRRANKKVRRISSFDGTEAITTQRITLARPM